MNFLMNNKKLVILLTVILSVLVGLATVRLRMDSSISSVLPTGDADYQYNNRISEDFGNSQEIIILLTSPSSVYTEGNLNLIQNITLYLKQKKEIQTEGVASITAILQQYNPDSETLDIRPDTVASIERRIDNNPLAVNQIVDPEKKITLVRAPLTVEAANNEQSTAVFIAKMKSDIETMLSEARDSDKPALSSDFTVEYTGTPIINTDITNYMVMDLIVLFPLAVLVVMVSIFLMLKSFRGMLIPLVITLLSVLWTFGVKGLFGVPLTLTETVIPVVLISIASADGIHITQQSLYFIRQGVPGQPAVLDSIKFVRLPIILSAVTTALGFGSLVFSPGQSMKNMGLFLAFGVLIAMAFTLYLAPVLISYFKPPQPKYRKKALSDKAASAAAKTVRNRDLALTVGDWVVKARWGIFVLTLVLIAVCIPGMVNIKTDLDEVRYFKEGAPVRTATEKIEQHLGGITNVYLVLESPKKNGVRSVDTMTDMTKIAEAAREQESVSFVTSYASYVQYLNYIFNKQQPEKFALPESRLYTQRFINTLEFTNQVPKNEVRKYMTADGTKANILIRLSNGNTVEMQKLSDRLDPILREMGYYEAGSKEIPEGAPTYKFAGDYIKIKNGSLIVSTQIGSLIGAIITIFVFISIIFKSPLVGLLITIPVSIAVFLNFTVMWLLGISLNPATAIIANVGVGAGVDYAIHYYSRFKRIFLLSQNYRQSLVDAFAESYRSIFSNAVSVAVGFLILLFSQYTIIRNFGMIISLTMMTSALGALTILPMLLSIFKVKVRK